MDNANSVEQDDIVKMVLNIGKSLTALASKVLDLSKQLSTVIADVAGLTSIVDWIADAHTWTYSSVDGATGVVTINADLTGLIHAGDRIKFVQTTTKYFIVSKDPTFGGGSTTLTFYGGTDYTLANAVISSPYYSHVKSPIGMNMSPTKWTVSLSDTSDRSQASPSVGTWYNLGSLSIDIPIGAWDVTWSCALESDRGSNGDTGCVATLSTANNTNSDSDFSVALIVKNTMSGASVLTKRKQLVLASKTTYYLNASVYYGSLNAVIFWASSMGIPTSVKAVCAYL